MMEAPVRTDRAALIGVTLMLIVAFMNAADAMIVRLLSHDIHPFVMGFTRSTFGALVVLPLILRRPQMLRTKFRWMHALRALLKLLSLVTLFAALAGAPLATVTAIGFAAPVFVAVGAWVFLREQPRGLRILAAALGFAGVLVILRPGAGGALVGGGGEVGTYLLLALLSAILLTTIQLMLKVMGQRDSADTLVAWNLLATVPIALIPAIWFWTTPTPAQWGLLALQGAFGAANQTLVTRAFQLADASLVAPIDFLRLPLVAGLAFLLFGEVVGAAVWGGAALIFVSTALMAATTRSRREAVRPVTPDDT